MSAHHEFHYSVTCHSDDKPVIYCLRAIAHFAERHQERNIAWGGTGDDEWEANDHRMTLRFTHPEFRQVFRDVANELLAGRWEEVYSSDDNPAQVPAERRRRVRRV